MADRDWVLVDGDCTLCRRTASWVRRHDVDGRFRIIPYQEAPTPPMTPDLFRACERAVHVVTVEGRVLRAGRAVLYMLENTQFRVKRLAGVRRALARVLALPPFIWPIEAAYWVVARNRPLFCICPLHKRERHARWMRPEVSGAPLIDRIAPTIRPSERQVMWQTWHDLLFLHWIVPVALLRPLIPPELEIDTFEGRAYVGLVPFTMTGVRPLWSPAIHQISDFHETNVRTYVHRNGSDPGVWFFSLDAANALAVRIARAAWRLPYHFARMELHKESSDKAGLRVDYSTERLWPLPIPAYCSTSYSVVGCGTPAAPGTLEHFLAERYILYAYARGALYSGQVHHVPYPLQTAEIHKLDETMLAAAGIPHPDTTPIVHYASRLDVRIFGLHRLKAAACP